MHFLYLLESSVSQTIKKVYREDKFIDGIDEKRLLFAESLVLAEVQLLTRPPESILPSRRDERDVEAAQVHAAVKRAMEARATTASPYELKEPRFKTFRCDDMT